MNQSQNPFDGWGATGANVPDLNGGYNLPPGNNGDIEWRSLVADAIAALYSVVGSAQRAPRTDDDQQNAVHQLLLANGCLAASEADAFLTLVSCGLEKPSEIHLRGLGEMTRRMMLSRERPEVALLLYGSAEQTWRKLGEKLGSSTIPLPKLGEKDMRQIEATADYKAAMAAVIAKYHLLNDLEWTMWSKRSHGDIYALVEVSQELAVRDGDVRRAANKTPQPEKQVDAMLQRAAGFVLIALNALVSEFGIDTRGRLEGLADKYKALQQRHSAEHNA